jgi:hypothetical protein
MSEGIQVLEVENQWVVMWKQISAWLVELGKLARYLEDFLVPRAWNSLIRSQRKTENPLV